MAKRRGQRDKAGRGGGQGGRRGNGRGGGQKQGGSRPLRLAFVALGCAKAMVDAERMLGDLGQAGFLLTDRLDDADVIVVNTCGFLASARDEALGELEEAARLRRDGRCSRLVVAGCLVQRDGEGLLEAVPEIDGLVGVHDRDRLVAVVRGEAPAVRIAERSAGIGTDSGRLRVTASHWAYLRVSEGCNQWCAFCTIPAIRGVMQSKPVGMVLDEAAELVADGARELILIGQETTSYGKDLGDSAGMAGLLRRLNEVDGAEWLRLMYTYPSSFDDATIEAMADCERVVKYVDMPIQHISDPVLAGMKRRVTRAQTEALLGKLRDAMPGMAIRTTLLVGFPGETDAMFEELLGFVKEFRFDAMGAFAYSAEEGTAAATMAGQVPEDVKADRLDRLMRVQQAVAFEMAAERKGDRFDVVVEGMDEARRVIGRHAGQAPEVDAVTLLEVDVATGGIASGDVVAVECVGSDGYDLVARLVVGR